MVKLKLYTHARHSKGWLGQAGVNVDWLNDFIQAVWFARIVGREAPLPELCTCRRRKASNLGAVSIDECTGLKRDPRLVDKTEIRWPRLFCETVNKTKFELCCVGRSGGWQPQLLAHQLPRGEG